MNKHVLILSAGLLGALVVVQGLSLTTVFADELIQGGEEAVAGMREFWEATTDAAAGIKHDADKAVADILEELQEVCVVTKYEAGEEVFGECPPGWVRGTVARIDLALGNAALELAELRAGQVGLADAALKRFTPSAIEELDLGSPASSADPSRKQRDACAERMRQADAEQKRLVGAYRAGRGDKDRLRKEIAALGRRFESSRRCVRFFKAQMDAPRRVAVSDPDRFGKQYGMALERSIGLRESLEAAEAQADMYLTRYRQGIEFSHAPGTDGGAALDETMTTLGDLAALGGIGDCFSMAEVRSGALVLPKDCRRSEGVKPSAADDRLFMDALKRHGN